MIRDKSKQTESWDALVSGVRDTLYRLAAVLQDTVATFRSSAADAGLVGACEALHGALSEELGRLNLALRVQGVAGMAADVADEVAMTARCCGELKVRFTLQ